MIRGFDSVNLDAIPKNDPTAILSGYVNGLFATWSELVRRFPVNPKLSITVNNRDGANIGDVEDKDMTIQQAPGWVSVERLLGHDPIIYCSAGKGPTRPGKWQDVRNEFIKQRVREPWYAIANYDLGEITEIPQEYLAHGCIGVQYRSDTKQDLDYSIWTDRALQIATGLKGGSEVSGVTGWTSADGTIRVAGVDGNGHPLLYTKEGGKWSVDDLTDEVINANPNDPRNKAGGYTVVP